MIQNTPMYLKFKVFLFFAFNLFVLFLGAQTLTLKQDVLIRQTITNQLGEWGENELLNKGVNTFQVLDSDTLYNPEGLHYVFKLTCDSAIRFDHSIWHGGNFNRFLFTYKHTLYALGGYGFFNTNNNLEYFNASIKEWSIKPTSGSVPPFINGLCFRNGDAIYSVHNIKSGNTASPDIFDSCVYILKVKTMTWERYYQQGFKNFMQGLNYNFKDYALYSNTLESILIKPSEMKFMIINNEENGMLHGRSLHSIDKNLFILENRGGSRKYYTDTVNIDNVWIKNQKNAQSFDLKPVIISITSNNNLSCFIGLVITAIAVFSIGFFAFQKSKRKAVIKPIEEKTIPTSFKSESKPEKETQPKDYNELNPESRAEQKNNSNSLYPLLFANEKNKFTGDEFDEILGISHLEPESKKLKRHRIILELQKQNPEFLIRIKESSDKRRYIYQIQKPS